MMKAFLLCPLFLVSAIAKCDAQIEQTPEYSRKVLFAFKQGAQNNCAAISVIKAAIATFGMDDNNGVFTSDTQKADGSHDVVLRNGSKVSVTKEQISQASQLAKLTIPLDDTHPGDPQMLAKANLLYAVMAEHATALTNESLFLDATSYARSVQRLSDPGRNSDVEPELLGLSCREFGLNDTSKLAYVHANYYHAAFASLADYDQDGKDLSIDPAFQKIHHAFRHNGENERENFILINPAGQVPVDPSDPCGDQKPATSSSTSTATAKLNGRSRKVEASAIGIR